MTAVPTEHVQYVHTSTFIRRLSNMTVGKQSPEYIPQDTEGSQLLIVKVTGNQLLLVKVTTFAVQILIQEGFT